MSLIAIVKRNIAKYTNYFFNSIITSYLYKNSSCDKYSIHVLSRKNSKYVTNIFSIKIQNYISFANISF